MVGFWDRLGISASLLCVIHCLLAPILVISIPFFSSWAAPNWFHWLMAGIIFPVAMLALWRGYNIHRRAVVLWLGGTGLIFIGLGLSTHGQTIEFVWTGIGGVFLVSAHLKNLRACQSC